MLFDEDKDILLAETVNVAAVAIVATGALQAVAEPAVGNPLLNLVVVLS